MIPKNLSGPELLKILAPFGYEVVRQKGSHIRIKTNRNGSHSETIPNHKPLREGTLHKILKNIADHFGMKKQDLEKLLFDNK
ncbi:type II toxin-antitoxin system HicA family toxin [Dyadobacter psychrotolerans]|nr:type II toxin-antitoxin system HicA family toxin [Dyadobacter psychrotolerans]